MRRHFYNPITSSMIAALLAATACIKKSSQSLDLNQNQIPDSRVPDSSDANPPSTSLGGYIPLTDRTDLGKKIADSSLVDTWFALAVCDCLPALQTSLTTSLNGFRGALPQALTPAIRREILSNPKLKLLNIVPRPLDNIVGGIFADEATIANEISDGLYAKIKMAENDWSASSETTKLQLDAFVPLPGTKETPIGRWVQLADVWSRWGLVFSQGGPWSSLRSSLPEKGMLWHELLRVLAEGEYLFGISGDGNGSQWGGLTLPIDLQINNPGAFDPRLPFNQVRFLSGFLDLNLPSNNSLSLARFGGERWVWRKNSIPLSEQSLQWWTAARMLNRLRPANRGQFAKFFLANSFLPDDGYQLSLLVLPGIDALLGGRFIDENTRLIQSALIDPQVSGVAQATRSKADPQSLSLLLMALSAWSVELKNVTDLSVSPETTTQLQAAPSSLLKGAQLIVQTLLAEHLRPRPEKDSDLPTTPWTLVQAQPNRMELPLRDQAQVLAALIYAEKSAMPSPYLRGRIAQLAAGLAERMDEPSAASASPLLLGEQLWLHTASSLFAKSYPEHPSASILQKRSDLLLQNLTQFERSALQ